MDIITILYLAVSFILGFGIIKVVIDFKRKREVEIRIKTLEQQVVDLQKEIEKLKKENQKTRDLIPELAEEEEENDGK